MMMCFDPSSKGTMPDEAFISELGTLHPIYIRRINIIMINKYEIYTMYTVLPRSILHPHSELLGDLELVGYLPIHLSYTHLCIYRIPSMCQ